jgi:hypothetical protein
MTHIDPFAPADSPQHPSNYLADTRPMMDQYSADDMSPTLYAIDGAPLLNHDTFEDDVEAREVEYAALIKHYGTVEQAMLWSNWDYTTGDDAPEELPTLAQLRSQDSPRKTKARASRKTRNAPDLDAALARLEQE